MFDKSFQEVTNNIKKAITKTQFEIMIDANNKLARVKDNNDKPSIGFILCQNKSNRIVDYSLKYINKPMVVSEYIEFEQLLEEIQCKLPTEQELNLLIDIEGNN